MFDVDDFIKTVLDEANETINKREKNHYRRVNKIKNQPEGDNESEGEIEIFPYSNICNYNWFLNWINRRENKHLMPTKQANYYMVYNKKTYDLVLTYNTETSEVRSSFDLNTILGLQKAKQ